MVKGLAFPSVKVPVKDDTHWTLRWSLVLCLLISGDCVKPLWHTLLLDSLVLSAVASFHSVLILFFHEMLLLPQQFGIPPDNLTWLWQITICNRELNYKWAIFNSYLKLRRGSSLVRTRHFFSPIQNGNSMKHLEQPQPGQLDWEWTALK